MMGTSQMDAVLGVANLVMMLGANLFVQSSLLAGAGLFACWMLRNRGAALRSAILRLTVVAILVCPLVSFGLTKAGFARLVVGLPRATLVPREVPVHTGSDTSRIPPRVPKATEVTQEPLTPAPAEPPSVHQAETPVSAAPEEFIPVLHRVERRTVPGPLVGVYLVLIGLWLFGSGFLLLRLLVAHFRLARLRFLANRASADVHDTCALLAEDLKVRPPRLLSYHLVKSPCLTGFLRPAILLPESTGTMDFHALRKVLIHELAHLVKRDCIWSLLSKLIHAMAFFQPFLWLLDRRLEEVADEVADDFVVHHDTDRWSYARTLVDIAEQMQPVLAEDLAGMGIVHFKSSLGRRLWRILDTTRELSTHITLRTTLLVTMLALCATLAAGLVGASSGFGPDAWAEKRLQEALALREEGLAITGGPSFRRDKFRESMQILERLVQEYPEVDEYRGELGLAMLQLGRNGGFSPEERLENATSAAEILEPVSRAYATNAGARKLLNTLADCHGEFSSALHALNRMPEALEAQRRAVATMYVLVDLEPDNVDYQAGLASELWVLGKLLITLQEPHAETMQEGWRHCEAYDRLIAQHGIEEQTNETIYWREGFVRTTNSSRFVLNPAEMLLGQGRPDDAVEYYEMVLHCFENLAEDHAQYNSDLLALQGKYALFLARIGRKEEAKSVRADREALREVVLARFPQLFQRYRRMQTKFFNNEDGPIANYRVRITTPGEYRLYVKLEAHDRNSCEILAFIDELADGPAGDIADTYRISRAAGNDFDANFATNPWRSTGLFESDGVETPVVWSIPAPGDYTLCVCGREDGVALDAFVLQRVGLPDPETRGPEESAITTEGVFLEDDGRVTVEAEHYASRRSHSATYIVADWLVVPDEATGDVPHANARGGAYLQLLPDFTPTFGEVVERTETEPDNPDAWSEAASRYTMYEKYDAAVAAYSKAIALDPANEDYWKERGWLHAMLGQVADAARDFVEVVALPPHDANDWYVLAMAQLVSGDMEAYRSTCADILERFHETGNANDAHWVFWTCVLVPDAVSDMSQLLQVAETAVQRNPGNGGLAQAYAVALYRADRLEEALLQLHTIADNPPLNMSSAYTWFFLAMTHFRLGHDDEARAWLQRATDQAASELQGNAAWNRRVTLQLLQNEAENLLGRTEVASRGT